MNTRTNNTQAQANNNDSKEEMNMNAQVNNTQAQAIELISSIKHNPSLSDAEYHDHKDAIATLVTNKRLNEILVLIVNAASTVGLDIAGVWDVFDAICHYDYASLTDEDVIRWFNDYTDACEDDVPFDDDKEVELIKDINCDTSIKVEARNKDLLIAYLGLKINVSYLKSLARELATYGIKLMHSERLYDILALIINKARAVGLDMIGVCDIFNGMCNYGLASLTDEDVIRWFNDYIDR